MTRKVRRSAGQRVGARKQSAAKAPVANQTAVTPMATKTNPVPSSTAVKTIRRAAPVAPKITKGAASVVFFYFGDSVYTSLAQETVKLKHAMEDYKFSVLLKHDNLPPFWDLSEKDEKLANVKDVPTQANLVEQMIELAQDGYMLDLFLSHGWEDKFRVSKGTYGDNGTFTTDEILSEFSPERTGLTQMPIRMVYGVNCFFKTMAPTWREIGAKVTGGARYVQFYPNQFPKFAKEWNKGNVGFEDAVRASDTAASRTVVQTYISVIHAPSTKKEWGGCPFGKFVLGDHDCAKDYFTDQWLANDEWQKNESGKENMNYSSRMFVGGERDLTKNDTPHWD